MGPKGHDRYGKYAHSWPITDRFGTKFVSRWLRLRGACLTEVHLHEKSFGGNVKWPFKTGARLIQVDTSTGGTVRRKIQIQWQIDFYLLLIKQALAYIFL